MQKLLNIVGIVILFACTAVPIFIDYMDASAFAYYAIAVLIVPTFYVIYRVWLRCITGIPVKEYVGGLGIMTYFGWSTVRDVLGYPASSIIWLGLGLLVLFFTLFYSYNEYKRHKVLKHKYLFFIYIILSLAVISFSGYHLITGDKVFNWRF